MVNIVIIIIMVDMLFCRECELVSNNDWMTDNKWMWIGRIKVINISVAFVVWTGIEITYCLHVAPQTSRQGIVWNCCLLVSWTDFNGANGCAKHNDNYGSNIGLESHWADKPQSVIYLLLLFWFPFNRPFFRLLQISSFPPKVHFFGVGRKSGAGRDCSNGICPAVPHRVPQCTKTAPLRIGLL